MEESGLHYRYRCQFFYAIKHYYSTRPNKKSLDWDEIKKNIDKKNYNTGKKLGYTVEEIKRLLDVGDVTDKAKILCLVSGMRREAMCEIELLNMDKTEDGIYMIKIYPNTEYEQLAFTTHEATTAIDLYKAKEKPEAKGIYLFPARQIKGNPEKNTRSLKGEHINRQSITIRMTQLSELAGLRKRKTDGTVSEKASHREEKPAVHGIRHFTINALKRPKPRIDSEIRKILVGHSIGAVQKAYSEDMTDEEILNNLKEEFLRAEKYLTIDQSLVLQEENTELKKAKSEIESLNAKINSMQQTQNQFTELSKKLYQAGILKKD